MATRALVLERLAAERRAAADCQQWEYVAELDERIKALSSDSSPVNPARETTAAPRRTPNRRSPKSVVRK